MGKSLDDVWRQMQAQRQAEQQARLHQERVLNEQRERARLEYLQRNRIYEKVGNISVPTSSSSAGGRIQQITPTSTSNQATLHYSYDSGDKILYYFIYNFGTSQLSEVKQVSFDTYPNIYPITEGGFFIYANNDENSNKDMIFIDLNADVAWQDTSDNQNDVDIENFSRYIGAYYLKDSNWKLVLFDENSTIKTFNFGENHIEGGGYSYNDVWSGGIVVVEEISSVYRYYIINFTEGTKTQFYEVDNGLGDYLNVYQYAYSNKILTRKNGNIWEVFDSSGQKLTEFNAVSEFSSNWYDNEFTFLNDNGSFLIFGYDVDNSNRTITLFSGSTNTFSSKIINTSTYYYYDYDMYNQKDYDSTTNRNAEGSAIFLFYDNSNKPDEVRYYSPEALILPIWSTDSELRDFYTFSSTRGINDSLDDSSIAFSRSADHICLLIDNAPEDDNYSILRFNREGDVTTVIPTNINKNRELNDEDQINGKTIFQFEREITNIGTWGWSDLSDVEDRFYYSLRYANNNQIGNYIEGQELVMKDVVNNQYWAIKFTDWQNSGGGGFAYTRQLISGGTYSGDLIHFTFSNFEQIESDVISEGILELRRGWNGPIYNVAKEGESNSHNPSGTLWNSEWVYNLETFYQYQWFHVDGSASNPTSSTDFNALFDGTSDGSGIEYNTNIDWTGVSGKPGYLPSTDFAWQVDCLLKVDFPGTYLFRTTSDDGNQLTIDGNVVTEFYGGRGIGSTYDTSGPLNLSTGLYTFRYRMQQGDGGSGARVEWQKPEDGTFSAIPSQNLVTNDIITEYDHYIIGTAGQIIGSVSTGNEYNNDYEGRTYILEDQVFNRTWVSNTENSQNWTLLDKYYEEYDDVNNIITEDGVRKGIYLLQNGFDYIIVTEDSHSATFSVPFTGSYLNKINSDDVFHKGAFILSYDETTSWLRFYDINGNLVDTIEKLGSFDNLGDQVYGDRCVIWWDQDGTKRFAFFDGESVTQFNSGKEDWNYSINDYNWWN
jgi:hypothetical protein